MSTIAISYDDVICPHCEKRNRFEARDMPWDDGIEDSLECQHCQKSFTVLAHIKTSWEIS
jgi:transposase-like protein